MDLIETPDGERMLVTSLRGHKGCTVIVRNAVHPVHGHAHLEDGRWVEDRAAKAAADAEARLSLMTRGELVDHIVARAKTIS